MGIGVGGDKRSAYRLLAARVRAAVQTQNAQFASGAIGAQPAAPDQAMTATVTVEGRFRSPQQFENVLLRTDPNGASVRLKDGAPATLGPAQSGFETNSGTTPAAAYGIQLPPTA